MGPVLFHRAGKSTRIWVSRYSFWIGFVNCICFFIIFFEL